MKVKRGKGRPYIKRYLLVDPIVAHLRDELTSNFGQDGWGVIALKLRERLDAIKKQGTYPDAGSAIHATRRQPHPRKRLTKNEEVCNHSSVDINAVCTECGSVCFPVNEEIENVC